MSWLLTRAGREKWMMIIPIACLVGGKLEQKTIIFCANDRQACARPADVGSVSCSETAIRPTIHICPSGRQIERRACGHADRGRDPQHHRRVADRNDSEPRA